MFQNGWTQSADTRQITHVEKQRSGKRKKKGGGGGGVGVEWQFGKSLDPLLYREAKHQSLPQILSSFEANLHFKKKYLSWKWYRCEKHQNIALRLKAAHKTGLHVPVNQ